jgi:hypothetical protein
MKEKRTIIDAPSTIGLLEKTDDKPLITYEGEKK